MFLRSLIDRTGLGLASVAIAALGAGEAVAGDYYRCRTGQSIHYGRVRYAPYASVHYSSGPRYVDYDDEVYVEPSYVTYRPAVYAPRPAYVYERPVHYVTPAYYGGGYYRSHYTPRAHVYQYAPRVYSHHDYYRPRSYAYASGYFGHHGRQFGFSFGRSGHHRSGGFSFGWRR